MLNSAISRQIVRCTALLGLVGLASCGGGGGSGATPGASGAPADISASSENQALAGADYFPLHVGDVWYYNSIVSATVDVRVTGTRVVNGRTVFVVASHDASGPSEDQVDKSTAGVSLVPALGTSGLESLVASLPLLPAPLVAGQSSVPLDQSFADGGDQDGDGRPDSGTLHAVVTVLGFESVTTPAGTWTKVAHVRTELRETVVLSSNNRQVTVTVTSDDWYAPDVGLVKSYLSGTGDGGTTTFDQRVLRAFHAGALRSEKQAPTITARTPVAGSSEAIPRVSVSFSESMDPAPPGSGAITVTAADGSIVPGTVIWSSDRDLTFHPAKDWVHGVYTATVTASAQDLVGNPATGDLRWSFLVDRQGPVATSIMPLDGDTGVPENVVIRIAFDEPPDPDTIRNVLLAERGSYIYVDLVRALSGKVLTLTPNAPLRRGVNYQILAGSVTDRFGNVGPSQTVASFAVDGGRFVAPQPITGLELKHAVLLADIDGDGRQDVISYGRADASQQFPDFYFSKQRPDGAFAAPVVIAPVATCPRVDVAVGDLDGDGRSDVVLTTYCGIETLRQDSTGSFVKLGQDTGIGKVAQPRIIRGRSRPMLVGMRGNDSAARPYVWMQSARGDLLGVGVLPTQFSAVREIHVADVNGDGLDDIVITGEIGSTFFFGVEVYMQRPDGSFDTPRQLPLPDGVSVEYIVVADMNGDGRPDLVMAGSVNYAYFVMVLLQDHANNFVASPAIIPDNYRFRIQVADIDGDGRPDILVSHSYDGSVGVSFQLADSSYGPELRYPAYDLSGSLLVGDLTGDGLPDLVGANQLMRQKPTAPGAAAAVKGKSGRGLATGLAAEVAAASAAARSR